MFLGGCVLYHFHGAYSLLQQLHNKHLQNLKLDSLITYTVNSRVSGTLWVLSKSVANARGRSVDEFTPVSITTSDLAAGQAPPCWRLLLGGSAALRPSVKSKRGPDHAPFSIITTDLAAGRAPPCWRLLLGGSAALRPLLKSKRGPDHAPFSIFTSCLLYTSPSPRDLSTSRMPSSA